VGAQEFEQEGNRRVKKERHSQFYTDSPFLKDYV